MVLLSSEKELHFPSVREEIKRKEISPKVIDIDDIDILSNIPLGQGGFSNVYKVVYHHHHHHHHQDSNKLLSEQEDNGYFIGSPKTSLPEVDFFYEEDCPTENTSCSSSTSLEDHEYALKLLRNDTSVRCHERGVLDIALEASLLSNLSHDHIIQLVGVSKHLQELEEFYCTENSIPPPHLNDPTLKSFTRCNDYFLLLQLLQKSTLEMKITEWTANEAETNSSIAEIKKKRNSCLFCFLNPTLRLILQGSNGEVKYCQEYISWLERLSILRDIASAMEYLHRHFIIYRDLKPNNIGFDFDNNVRLFDFGLAKKLRRDELQPNGLYKMTGNTGSLLYMAPEIVRNQPYDMRADVYSFGILLWQICALEKPFHGLSRWKYIDRVVKGRARPIVDIHWPRNIVELMSMCWQHDIRNRPDFEHIRCVLEEEVVRVKEKLSFLEDHHVFLRK